MPWVLLAVATLAAVGVPAVSAYQSYVSARNQQAQQQVQQAAIAQQQAFSAQVSSQMMVERVTPLLWVTVPAMVAVGGYFLWKAREAGRE
jgi:Tfp pilus assembly protein PilV